MEEVRVDQFLIRNLLLFRKFRIKKEKSLEFMFLPRDSDSLWRAHELDFSDTLIKRAIRKKARR